MKDRRAVRQSRDAGADGTVTADRVLRVPRDGLGFDAAVEQAVRQWSFQPATVDGKLIAGSYSGAFRFVMPATFIGEVMS